MKKNVSFFVRRFLLILLHIKINFYQRVLKASALIQLPVNRWNPLWKKMAA